MRKRTPVMIGAAAILLGGPLVLRAQEAGGDPGGPAPGWRRFGEDAPIAAALPPASLTIPAGTWIPVRIEQELSSDRNTAGDAFTASLAQPLVAGGYVVARRGQTVAGRVVEAVKAGRAKGTSRLAVELTELALVDGRQVAIRTRLAEQAAGSSAGRDVGAVATTAGVGAAIGAAAEGGFGAGIGALAGAAAGMIGVMTTRGKPTILYPESVVTFRLEEPLTVFTEGSAQAFLPVRPEDYAQREPAPLRRASAPPPRPYYYGGWWDWWYGPYYRPWFYGPAIRIYTGPRFIGGHGRRR